MNRRGFIGSAIAVIGSLILPTTVLARLSEPSLLEKTKFRLLPGLWGLFQDTDIPTDIRVEDGFLVVYAGEWKSGLGFSITENSIRRGYYLEEFSKTTLLLKELAIEQFEWDKWKHTYTGRI